MKKHRILCAVLALLVLTVPACGKKKTPLDYGMKIAAKLDKKDYRVGIWAQKGPKGGEYYSISISSADEEDILYTPEDVREFISEVADLVRDGYSEHDFLLPHERF